MNKVDLQKVFENFNNLNILIIGDVMIDAYAWGTVDRISPEAPVPILSCTKRDNRLGGAANVALNILSLGAKPTLCSVIGKDDKADIFIGLMNDINLDTSGIIKSENRRTTVKTRFISNNQHLIRIDEEDTHELADEIEIEFISHIKQLIDSRSFDAVVFEDYDKGSISIKLIQEITKLSNDKELPILVDPKKRHYNNYKNVSLFKPNFKEFIEGCNVNISNTDIEKLNSVSNQFREKMNIDQVLITLSEKGIFINEDNNFVHLPAEVREIADVSGAGDTVISVATCCLAAKMDAMHIAAISNLAGGIVCEVPVVIPINKEQLLEESILYFQNYLHK